MVAIDGRSGCGKSTLAQSLSAHTHGVWVDQDDFYAGGDVGDWIPRKPADRADQCIDWQRVRDELLVPLRAGEQAVYAPFDWDTMTHSPSIVRTVEPTNVLILDGTYSTRKELLPLIDITVLVTLDDHSRLQRLRQREGEAWSDDWFRIWDEAEDWYFTYARSPNRFDFLMSSAPDTPR